MGKGEGGGGEEGRKGRGGERGVALRETVVGKRREREESEGGKGRRLMMGGDGEMGTKGDKKGYVKNLGMEKNWYGFFRNGGNLWFVFRRFPVCGNTPCMGDEGKWSKNLVKILRQWGNIL